MRMKKIMVAIMSFCLSSMLMIGASAVSPISDFRDSSNGQKLNSIPRTINANEFENFEVGESKVLFEDETGITYIVLDDMTQKSTGKERYGEQMTTYSSYSIRHKDLFGNDSVAVALSSECSWRNYGTNSYITNLRGKYTIYNDAYSCSWNDDHETASDTYHSLGLDVTYGSKTRTYIMDAALLNTNNPPSVNLGFYSY